MQSTLFMGSKKISHKLGDLEAKVMEIIWRRNNASVRDVFNELKRKKKIAYTTVMTVMFRLYNKGILKRKLSPEGAYIYSPRKDKEKFFAFVAKKVIHNLIKEYGEVAVAQFIDVVETSNRKCLAEWRRKLKKIK